MADSPYDTYISTMRGIGVPEPTQSVFTVGEPGEQSIDRSDEVMVCAVCKMPLNRFKASDSDPVYLHAQSWANHDHEVVPQAIPRRDSYANQNCDFCGLLGQTYYRFLGSNITHDSGGLVQNMGDIWGGCQECSALIMAGDLEGLLARFVRVSVAAKSGDAELDRLLRAQTLNVWTAFMNTVYDSEYVGPRREPVRLNARMMPKLQRGLLKFWRNENLLTVFTRNRTANGMRHSIPGIHCGDEDVFCKRFPPGVTIPDNVWLNHVQHLTAGIEGSDLYWISKDFTQLAIMAGKDFDKLVISREELPSAFGFMVFEDAIGAIARPGGSAAIRGVSWTLVPQGVWINLYMQGEDGDPDVDVEQMRQELGYLMCPNAGGGFVFNDEFEMTDENFQFIATIFATWFLMGQPGVADRDAAPVDKKYARSYQRTYNRRLPDVILIDLRKRPQRATDAATHVGRPLSVRIYRRGHWKRQAYGEKRGLRKTIYVSGYIAGPEGAPLKAPPSQVKVLR
jgi:hypothetical protein